jgi:uncharacterized protein YjhX (UPF0386 family)
VDSFINKNEKRLETLKITCIVNENQPKKQDSEKGYFYSGGKLGTSYPVNIMRNAALQIIQTEIGFLIDVDFCPDIDLYQKLKNLKKLQSKNVKPLRIKERDNFFKIPSTKELSGNLYELLNTSVFVVPAFDFDLKNKEPPKTKEGRFQNI